MNTVILSLSLVIASVSLPALASPPSTSFATRLLSEVQGLRLTKQITLNIGQTQNRGSFLSPRASLNLIDGYLDSSQNEMLYDEVLTAHGTSREKFDNLVAICQLERQCKQLVAQQNQNSENNEELASQARQLFEQHQHLFDEAASQRLTLQEQTSPEENLMSSLREEELEEEGDFNFPIGVIYETEPGLHETSSLQAGNEGLVLSDDVAANLPWLATGVTASMVLNTENTRTNRPSDSIFGSRDNIDTVNTIKSSEDFYRVSDEIASQLIKAVYKNSTDDIARILDENLLTANIVIDDIGTTLLQHAANEGILRIVQYLIDSLAADINIENKLNFTALDAAVFAQQHLTAKFLIERGAVSSRRDPQDTNPKGAPTLAR